MPRTGLVRSIVRDYNGTDWTRSILWAKDEFLLVLDDVVAQQPAHFALQCYWRTLGECRVDGQTLSVSQQERPMVVRVEDADCSAGAAVRFAAPVAHLIFEVDLPAGKQEIEIRAQAPNAASDSLHVDVDGKRVATVGTGVGRFAAEAGAFELAEAGKRTVS